MCAESQDDQQGRLHALLTAMAVVVDEVLKEFVNLATPAMALVDLEGRLLALSPAFAAALGHTDDLVGQPASMWAPASWVEAIAQAAQGETVQGEGEHLTRSDGQLRWLRWTTQPWKGGGIIIAAEDVTASRQALSAAELREGRLYQHVRGLTALSRSSFLAEADLVGLAAEATAVIGATLCVERVDVWMVEEDTKFLQCIDSYNYITQSHSGQAPVSMDDVPVLYMLAQQGHLARADIDADPIMQTSRPLFDVHARSAVVAGVSAESTLLGLVVCQSTGSQREWSLDDRAFVASVASTMALAVETTRRRAAEAIAQERMVQVDEARARAEAADKAKGEFLATMSHEIRTPMNGVIGFTNLLMDSNLDDDQRSFAATIKASADSLLTLINDILDFSKIEAGKFDLESIPFDLETILGDAMELCSARADEKGVGLALKYPAELPRRFQGDPGRVRQVVLNLVGNGIKFTSSGVVSVRVSAEGKGVKIEIVDSGIGISPEGLSRLFTRFAQADSSTTRKYGGTGLGLAISRRLVELMGGAIGVESTAGVGSIFWFTLGNPLEAQSAPVLAPQGTPQTRVLLLESQEPVRQMWASALSRMNAEVTSVASATSAASLSGYDVVVATELEVLALAASLKPAPRVLLRVSNLRGGKPPGAAGIVARSLVRPESLVRAVRLALDQTGAGAQVDPAQRPIVPVNAAVLAGLDVLLVEDNLVNQRLADRLLTRRGCKVTLAVNGLEGVSRWEERRFDVILMDGHMPEMDGFEATRRIRVLEQERGLTRTPIIALTADAMQGDRERCLAAGMDDYLTKPLLDEKLVSTLQPLVVAREVPRTG